MIPQDTPPLIAVMGPTGSGKSDFAEVVADDLGARLVNADAFMVYRGFDIGTNKPERRAEYALMDHVDPRMSGYGVGEFVVEAAEVLQEAFKRSQAVVVVGGTGLYIRALFEGYTQMAGEPDPELRASVQSIFGEVGIEGLRDQVLRLDPTARVDWANPVRVRRALERLLAPTDPVKFSIPEFRRFKVGLLAPPDWLNPRLEARVSAMIAKGWQNEVASLIETGVPQDAPAMRAIGYSTFARQLMGDISLEDAVEEVRRLTRQYAKRQRSWLRSEPSLVEFSAEMGVSDLRLELHTLLRT